MSGQVGVLSRHPTQMLRHRRTGGTSELQEATDVEREEPHASALVFDHGKRTVWARAEITSAYRAQLCHRFGSPDRTKPQA